MPATKPYSKAADEKHPELRASLRNAIRNYTGRTIQEHDTEAKATGRKYFGVDMTIQADTNVTLEEEIRDSYWTSGDFPNGGASIPARKTRLLETGDIDLYVQLGLHETLFIIPGSAILEHDTMPVSCSNWSTTDHMYRGIEENEVDIYRIKGNTLVPVPGKCSHGYLEVLKNENELS